MKDKKSTYNKDGTQRKSGSGRKKGSNSFVRVTFETLGEYIGQKTPILVSRVWLENLGISSGSGEKVKLELTEEEKSDKILFQLNNFNEEE